MPTKKSKMTKEEIRTILEQHYSKVYRTKIINRKLLTHKSENSYFFELKGTPPKGYGIYIPYNKFLYLHDQEGKRFKKYSLESGIVDLNE